jgi:hypothetical protein
MEKKSKGLATRHLLQDGWVICRQKSKNFQGVVVDLRHLPKDRRRSGSGIISFSMITQVGSQGATKDWTEC